MYPADGGGNNKYSVLESPPNDHCDRLFVHGPDPCLPHSEPFGARLVRVAAGRRHIPTIRLST